MAKRRSKKKIKTVEPKKSKKSKAKPIKKVQKPKPKKSTPTKLVEKPTPVEIADWKDITSVEKEMSTNIEHRLEIEVEGLRELDDRHICRACNGQGQVDGVTCLRCKGKGNLKVSWMLIEDLEDETRGGGSP